MREVQRMSPGSGNHEDVLRRGNLRPVATKKFPQQSFHPISGDCIAETPRDGDAQAGRVPFGGKYDDYKMRAMATFPATLEEKKLSARKQTSGLGE